MIEKEELKKRIAQLEEKLEREKLSRQKAEKLLSDKNRELYELHQKLSEETIALTTKTVLAKLPQKEPESKDKTANKGDYKNIRILTVDDHPINRIFVVKLLQKIGFDHVDSAENGQEALNLMLKNNYHIIFMDCHMPIMDGYEATEAFRKENKTTPIIALTANDHEQSREQCTNIGMNGYLIKPVKQESLEKTIEQYLDISSIQEETKKQKPETEAPTFIDLERLNIFTDGDPEEEKKLVDLFLEQATITIEKLKNATDPASQTAWKESAHLMKGSSFNLGSDTLGKICADAEDAYTKDENIKLEFLFKIKDELSKIRSFFKQREN